MEKQIRCISIDIDGTLIKEGGIDHNHISEDNINEIKKFCEKGGRIILSTGRDFRNTDCICRYLYRKGVPMNSIPYLVCLNGAVIIDNRDHRTIISRKNFDPVLCREISNFLQNKRLIFFLIGSDNRLFSSSNPFTKLVLFFLRKKRDFMYEQFPIYKNTEFKNIQKIIIIKLIPGIRDLKNEISNVFGDRSYCSSGPKHYLEIVDKRVNKFFALEKVSRLLNIPISEFAAIGNEENDIMSIEGVGYGVGVDLEGKRGLFEWNEENIQFHVNNFEGKAVANAIKEMRLKGFF